MSSHHHSKRNKNQNKNKQSIMESEPHSYNIQAKLQSGILSIFVHDTMTNLKWRQEFTQISFPGHKLYNVAKSLIMAIQEMIDNTNYSTKGNNNNNNLNDNDTEKKPIAILVYNQWCYLTIHGSNLPSFALRPIIKDQQNQTIIHSPKNKNKNQQQKKNKNIQLKTIKPSIAPYGFTTNSQNNNIKFGDKNRDKRINKNITFKNNDGNNDINNNNNNNNNDNVIKRRPKSKSTPIIVVNKGVVARNIARFSNTNSNKTSYSSNSNRKSNTNKHRNHKSKKSNKTNNKTNTNNNNINSKPRKKLPSNPPPTLNPHQSQQLFQSKTNSSTLAAIQPMRPPTPSRKSRYFPGKPLPTLPIASSSSYHNHYQQPTIHRNQAHSVQKQYYHNNHNNHNNNNYNNNLSQPIEPRYSASATNNIRFQQMLMDRNHHNGSVTNHRMPSSQSVQPYIPAPPIPKKQIMAKQSQVIVTVIGHNYNQQQKQQQGQRQQFELQPGQQALEQQQQQQQPGCNQRDERQEISTPKYKKHDSIPVPTSASMGNRSNSSSALSGVTNLSGVSHLDVVGCSSSDYDDEVDGSMINSDDDDSSSFKDIGHRSDDSRQGSVDSNTGSLDSLFTNDGGDGIITGFMTEQQYNQRSNRSPSRHKQIDSAKLNLPANKMKLYDSITTIDMNDNNESSDNDDNYHNDDILECEFSGNEDEYEIDHHSLVDYQPRQSGPCGYLYNVSSNRTNQTNVSLITHLTGRPTKAINNQWNDNDNDYHHDQLDIDDQTEGHTVNSSLYYHNTMSDDEETPNHHIYSNNNNDNNNNHRSHHQSSKKKKKKGKKSKKKAKKRNSIKLTICLNGDIIDDMVGHVIDQQIAEEEYYEEEDAMSEPYYDPNFLGVNPYYSD